MKSALSTVAVAALVGACASSSNTSAEDMENTAKQASSRPAAAANLQNIVAVAQQAGGFNTLVAALNAGDLAGALKGEGPFTVFAPTDEAFAALPDGTLESLLQPENKAQLQNILKYHVVPGKVMANQVVGLDSAETLAGSVLPVQTMGGKVKVGDANVIQTDVAASNGVIHVIDKVLLPPQ